MSSRTAAILSALVLALLPLGCESGPSDDRLAVEGRLRSVAVLYGRYQAQHRGQPPKNRQEFEGFLQTLDPKEYATLGVPSASELLVSPRDGTPFIVNYGADAGPPGPDGSGPVIAYEAGPAGEPVLGVNSVGRVETMDAPPSS